MKNPKRPHWESNKGHSSHYQHRVKQQYTQHRKNFETQIQCWIKRKHENVIFWNEPEDIGPGIDKMFRKLLRLLAVKIQVKIVNWASVSYAASAHKLYAPCF